MFRDESGSATTSNDQVAGPSTDTGQPTVTVLVGENALLRAGLKHLLSGSSFTAADAKLTMDSSPLSYAGSAPELYIVDASDFSEQTLKFVQVAKSQSPLARVVVVANDFDLGSIQLAVAAGVDSFFLATGGCEVLIKTLELTLLGEQVIPGALLQSLLNRVPSASHAGMLSSTAEHVHSDPRTQKLSPREATILQSLMGGDSNKVIARKLDISEATIKVHVKAILRKIGVANRTQAAIWGSENLRAMDQPPANH